MPTPDASITDLIELDVFSSDDETDKFVAVGREWRQADLGEFGGA